jgi:hypothetical protein
MKTNAVSFFANVLAFTLAVGFYTPDSTTATRLNSE